MKYQVPEKFYNGELKQPVAHTVGELKEILSQLPDNLPLSIDGRHASIELVVYNVSEDDAHLCFEDSDDLLICEL